MTASGNRYGHIDAMRAMAVMLVVVAHAGYSDIVPGGSGVTIFFTISGFIITHLLLREKDASGGFKIGSFYFRRFLKIGPPLLICTIIPTLVLAMFTPINWPPFFGVAFFYYNWFAAAGVHPPLPGSNVVWSLSIEEQFYLVFALIWLIAVRSRAYGRWVTVIATIGIVWSVTARVILTCSGGDQSDRIYFGSDTRLDGIAWGVLAAIALRHSLRDAGRIQSLVRFGTRDSMLFAAVMLYLCSLLVRDDWFRDSLRFTFQAVAACVVIIYGFGTTRSRLRSVFDWISRVRAVRFIGLASYSIYLIHMVAISYTAQLVDQLPSMPANGVKIAIGVGAGVLVYLCVERPVQRFRFRLTSTVRAQQANDIAAVRASASA